MSRRTSWQDDPDLKNAEAALQRAARKAREIAEQTGTPFYVLREGKIVDLIAEEKTRNGKNEVVDHK